MPDQAALASAGIDAREAQSVAEAYKLASARASEVALANCAAWLGDNPATVERIGAENCESILDEQAEKVPGVSRQAAGSHGASVSQMFSMFPKFVTCWETGALFVSIAGAASPEPNRTPRSSARFKKAPCVSPMSSRKSPMRCA